MYKSIQYTQFSWLISVAKPGYHIPPISILHLLASSVSSINSTGFICPPRPAESHSRAQETITVGSSCAEIETLKASRGRKRREGCPCTIRLGVWGSDVCSRSGSGAELRPKMDFMQTCIVEVRKKPSGTPFSVFLSTGGAPKRRGARENFPPPPPPLSTGLCPP